MRQKFVAKVPIVQSSKEDWRRSWQALVPEECRNVAVSHNDQSVTAYICRNHFAVMLQDGLLMDPGFFGVCEHFQKAGYRVVWLIRFSQDLHNGFVRRAMGGGRDGRRKWIWRKPTTNFGRWTSDNYGATILLQEKDATGDLLQVNDPILHRVIWAESSDPGSMVPSRTRFTTISNPATPAQLMAWLDGTPLGQLHP